MDLSGTWDESLSGLGWRNCDSSPNWKERTGPITHLPPEMIKHELQELPLADDGPSLVFPPAPESFGDCCNLFDGSLLPKDSDMARGRKPVAPLAQMAPGATTGSGTANSANRPIPLVCTVCPESPRFSDVSHLLTHIASKGHLHHETQTKLRAHENIAASVALQHYDRWYRENGIEALLVERMRAKQAKEAARNKRSRPMSSALPKTKRKTKRGSTRSTVVKAEPAEVAADFPLYPGLFHSDNEMEVADDYLVSAEALNLKGQVWPGMGKMDLANEEMKRTRNQRKPKSVIERMRRTSEGIEPTQVVMSSDFEVERVKGVYDDSESPAPGQEESTPPRKIPKPRRRKLDALHEVSTNVPRQRRSTRNNGLAAVKGARSKAPYSSNELAEVNSLGSFRQSHDIFRDDAQSTFSDNTSFSGASYNDQRYDLRGRLAMPALNPISHSNLVSPTPSSRAIPTRLFGEPECDRGRSQTQSYMVPPGHIDSPYALTNSSIYNNHTQLPFHNHYDGTVSDRFRLSSSTSIQTKQEHLSNPSDGDVARGSNNNQFLNIPGANPLFSEERLFLSSYNSATPGQALPPLSFTPANRSRDHCLNSYEFNQSEFSQSEGDDANTKAQLCNGLDHGNQTNETDSSFSSNDDIWNSQAPNPTLDLHDALNL